MMDDNATLSVIALISRLRRLGPEALDCLVSIVPKSPVETWLRDPGLIELIGEEGSSHVHISIVSPANEDAQEEEGNPTTLRKLIADLENLPDVPVYVNDDEVELHMEIMDIAVVESENHQASNVRISVMTDSMRVTGALRFRKMRGLPWRVGQC